MGEDLQGNSYWEVDAAGRETGQTALQAGEAAYTATARRSGDRVLQEPGSTARRRDRPQVHDQANR
jgi:hypothetical protein